MYYLHLLRGLGFAFGFDLAAAFLEAFGTGVVDFVFGDVFGCAEG